MRPFNTKTNGSTQKRWAIHPVSPDDCDPLQLAGNSFVHLQKNTKSSFSVKRLIPVSPHNVRPTYPQED